MNLIEMARNSGMQVLLDAQIGRQTYHSVTGSLTSLQKFADAVRESIKLELSLETEGEASGQAGA